VRGLGAAAARVERIGRIAAFLDAEPDWGGARIAYLQGDASTRQIATGATTVAAMAVPGSELTAARGVDVLPLLDRVAKALAANDTTTLATAIDDLGTAVSQVSLARTRTGGASAVLDATLVAHDALADHLTTTMANAIEVDAVAAASDLAKASQALEISRAVTSHVVALLDPSAR